MMVTISNTRYTARIARNETDLALAQGLRFTAFMDRTKSAGDETETGALDRDSFDDICTHFLIEDEALRRLVGCFRILPLKSGTALSQSYSAQFYDLSALAVFGAPMVELGRFCMHPDVHDPDILRVAWGALTRFVDAQGIKMLFGCSSFTGIDPRRYADGFALLAARHLAPAHWQPESRAPEHIRFADMPRGNTAKGLGALPPLLRTYLLMGGWVSDHAVVDRQMDTLHVFTGLEIDAIPETRKRLLRMTAERLDAPVVAR